MLTFYRRLRQNNTFIWQTFDLKELYVIKTNIVIQIIVISAIEKYCSTTIFSMAPQFFCITVQLKRKTQIPCLIKDYRNAELTSSPCVYVDGPRNNVDMTDRTRRFHESITDCNYWNVHS